ncbi:MAG: DNA topoisomerase I, partial [Arenibacter sp.]|nr:DNA topoisomerase I [Arenibacter sp.]
AIELIKAKQKADAPITTYEGKDVTKGVGRFGPFIKWDGMFINVSKKYDFDNLTQENIEEIIEIKKQKEIDKLIQEWPEEGIRIEKARWGRHSIIKGKIKVEVSKDVDATKISLKEAKELIEKKTPKKKTKAKPKAKK